MKRWEIVADTLIYRDDEPVALIVPFEGKLAWGWWDTSAAVRVERAGFSTKADVLADVKYFWKHNPPRLRISYQSGRVIEYR